jgi:DNA-binding CsgD family transcriptional regulator
MLDFLRVALENDRPEAFPEPVLDELRRLIPCACVSHHEWDGLGDYRFWLSTDEPARVLDVWSAYGEVRGQDPLPGGATNAERKPRVPIGEARKFSDFLTLRAFRRLDLHDRVCRPLGVDYVMKLFLPTRTGGSGFVFDAGRKDFSERDRAVLDALVPHLGRLRQRAGAVSARTGENDVIELLTCREQQVLRLAASGLTNRRIANALYIAPGTVRKHLDNIYAKLGVQNRTAAVNRAFLRSA